MKKLLFGAAYYDEYMPYDRLDKDIEMMKKAGINTVRIAESTWSTCEPQDGVFDFSHVERVMDAMEEAGIHVIIGTPTYAVPAWMVKAHPDVIATTKNGAGIYGARQIMDITNPVYLFYAERVIRKLMEVSAGRKCVIGFQVDNETKYYGTAGKNVQLAFVKYLRKKFQDDLDAMNHEFGLDYWSNRIDAWEDFPDVRGTINGSLGAEFEKFQRTLVDQFLSWQAGIVSEYKREDQFITHNLDFEWRGYSYGVQPDVNHLHASQALTIAGTDIYHPSQDDLTGTEIAFGGDMIRSLKHDNYLVLETEAQGFPCWTPYKGQLRLCAYSHLASGANSVMYWHWHSIHNSFETYWKGLLSHDFAENDTYREACIIGKEFREKGSRLVNLKKKNDVAVMVSNEALTALNWFGIQATSGDNGEIRYNDVVRWIYDALYQIMGAESFQHNMEKGLIEVAPLAYMRGRTLDNSFIILDEAQNTTPAQMKMFLTRIGFGSKVVITGDLTQKDLPHDQASGLDTALKVLRNVEEIGICRLTSSDVVRHPLVQKIVKAYDEYENRKLTDGGNKNVSADKSGASAKIKRTKADKQKK